MRCAVLAPLFLMTLGAAAEETHARETADPARKCPPPVLTAGAPKAGGPTRKLNEEPLAALIATVAVQLDGCPMMLVLDGGESGVARGWKPVPESRLHPIQ